MKVTLEREMPLSGATIRVALEPLEGERVRVVQMSRRKPDSERFFKVDGEAGRICRWDQLGFDRPFAEVFGGKP